MLGDFLETPGKSQTATPTGKRTRRSVERHSPAQYRSDVSSKQLPGRGVKLSSIPSVQKNVSGRARTDEGLKFGHKFLYGFGRGRKKAAAKITVLKNQILDYSGFLVEGATAEEDEDKIEKFKVYAFKVMLPSLKDLCDLFDIDRSGA